MNVTLARLSSPRRSLWETWWWGVADQIASFAYVTGLVSSGSVSWFHDKRNRPVGQRQIRLGFHPRPYVLWRRREDWFHHVRYGHHRYNIEVVPCGTCLPWPCCNAVGLDHASTCTEFSA